MYDKYEQEQKGEWSRVLAVRVKWHQRSSLYSNCTTLMQKSTENRGEASTPVWQNAALAAAVSLPET
jgi:hypothetical protein